MRNEHHPEQYGRTHGQAYGGLGVHGIEGVTRLQVGPGLHHMPPLHLWDRRLLPNTAGVPPSVTAVATGRAPDQEVPSLDDQTGKAGRVVPRGRLMTNDVLPYGLLRTAGAGLNCRHYESAPAFLCRPLCVCSLYQGLVPNEKVSSVVCRDWVPRNRTGA